jgi:hypothetical protein
MTASRRGLAGLVWAVSIFFAVLPVRAEQDAPHPSNSAGGDLSEKLNRSEGVIKPRQNVDPELQVQPPESADKMPVIPPPGTQGGNSDVRPK